MLFRITETGLDETIKFLEDYRKSFRDYNDFLVEKVEPELKDLFQKCFQTRGFGKWRRLAQSTINYKLSQGRSTDILVFSGAYRAACIKLKGKKLGRNNLKITSPIDHAIYHELGTSSIPERPVFKFVADRMRRKIRKLYREYNQEITS